MMISWPEQLGGGRPGRTNSFTEFVDIFPTLADLADIPVPPLCPMDSSKVRLCTEGVSLRPLFADPTHVVKRAAFSQYPHRANLDGSALAAADIRYLTIGDETIVDVSPDPPSQQQQMGKQQEEVACSTRNGVLGSWYSTGGTLFILKAHQLDHQVTLDASHCHDCSFISGDGHQTANAGVTLTLRFKPPSIEVDVLTGALHNGSCELVWSTNSTSVSGQVSGPFPYWNRSILTDIYLCHACSC
jgi:hypothetical protein